MFKCHGNERQGLALVWIGRDTEKSRKTIKNIFFKITSKDVILQ